MIMFGHQDVFELYQEHMTLIEADEAYIPKHHIMMHCFDRCAFHGNPKLYGTWKSEANNKKLKLACRQVSQVSFDTTVLLRMKHVLKLLKRRQRQSG